MRPSPRRPTPPLIARDVLGMTPLARTQIIDAHESVAHDMTWRFHVDPGVETDDDTE
jgi:hypothetical protein